MKKEFPLVEAESIGRRYVEALRPLCSRVEIAGSVRRRVPVVGDLEIVCVSRLEPGIGCYVSALDRVDWTLYGKVLADGPRQKKILLQEGLRLDLFIATADTWGYIFLLRTGPKEFSRKMVTPKSKRGFMPGYLRCDDGAIWNRDKMEVTPEEMDVFSLYGMPYVEPGKRK